MANQLKELLGLDVPILQGGMAWISEANLASAVSNAGGAGIISTGGRTTEYTRDEICRCRSLTNRPFGVNVMLMAPNKEEIVDVICEEKPAFVTLGAGNPVPYFEKLHAAGVKVIPVVPSVKLAKRVEEKGADAIVVEGMEAGGHIGVLSTMPLMEQVIPEVSLPVIMAGGFGDGRGLAAALLMGAAGVQMGTRFLVAQECDRFGSNACGQRVVLVEVVGGRRGKVGARGGDVQDLLGARIHIGCLQRPGFGGSGLRTSIQSCVHTGANA